jgi:bacteriorhodopsin
MRARAMLGAAVLGGLACAVVLAVIAVVVRFPGAGWDLPTFGVAFLPGLAFATLISGLGAKRA